MAVIYILEYLFFGFIGWLIDSGYRSLREGKLINAGYFRGPFCSIYGVGAVVLIFVGKYFGGPHPYLLAFFGGLCLVLVEYFGGLFSEKVLQVKLWDYTSSRFHIGGYIDLLHGIYWFVLAALFYIGVFPLILTAEGWLDIPRFWELPALVVFIIVFVWLTARKNPSRFLEVKGRLLNLTVDDYQQVLADINKLRRAKTAELKEKIAALIKKQLENSGAELKERP